MKKLKNYRHLLVQNNKGMTLVEIMVAMVLVSIISAVIYNVALTQMKSANDSGSVMQSAASPLAGIEIIKRDLSLAGYGSLDLLDATHQKNIALLIEDGGDNKPDKLYLFDGSYIDIQELAYDYYAELGQSPISSGSGSSNITLERLNLDSITSQYDNTYGVTNNPNEFEGSISQYVITNTDDTTKKVAKINSISGKTLSLDGVVKGTQAGPAVFFCLDDGTDTQCHPAGGDTGVLRRSNRSSGGRQPVVENLVDMQIIYKSGSTWYGQTAGSGMNPFYAGTIDLIQISLIGRAGTSKEVPVAVQIANGQSWGSSSDTDAGTGEYNKYRAYTINIRPRNNIEFK